MYNSFIRQRLIANQEEKINKDKKVKLWKKRYQTEVQPQLLEHYEKRVASFLQNLGETPIMINSQQKTIQSHKVKFVFKGEEDWTSIYNLRERLQKTENEVWRIKNNKDEMHSLNPLSNQSSPIRQQFRSRIKAKEIHPPMKYYSKQAQFTIYHIRKAKRSSLREVRQGKGQKKQQLKEISNKETKRTHSVPSNNMRTSRASASSMSKNQQEDEANVLKKETHDFIEVEAKKYEKERQIKQKKHHFKKLLDLSLTNTDEAHRQQIRKVLKRCGYLNEKKVIGQTQTSQMDELTSIIEKGFYK